jgi:hypothetical protein
MKYFTRSWYQSIQAASRKLPNRPIADEGQSFESPWELGSRATAGYHLHLSQIAPKLGGEVARLVCYHLHDAKIVQVANSRDTVLFVVRDVFSKRRYNREIRLTFAGVVAAAGLSGVEGQDIIYDEVDVRGDGVFEYSALLDRDELSIHFNTVQVESHSI